MSGIFARILFALRDEQTNAYAAEIVEIRRQLDGTAARPSLTLDWRV